MGPTRRIAPLDASTATNRSRRVVERRNSGHGEAEMIESTPLEHRRAEAVDRRVVAGQLEDVESMTSPAANTA